MTSVRRLLRRLRQSVRARSSSESGPASGASRRSDTSKVTSRWDQLAQPEFVRDLANRSWTGIPQIHLNHNFRVTGDRNQYWVTFLQERYFANRGPLDVLSLGCGEGHLDRILQQSGFRLRSLTGLDISPVAVARAAELATQVQLAPRIRYAAVDLNSHVFDEQYDFIYFFQSLHHVEALEHALEQCRRALRPDGLLMVNEFVGPTRFQWTDRQKQWANALLDLLPEALRVDLLHNDGRLKTQVVCPTVADMINGDPSEAVRSGDIERVLQEYFEVLDAWNWGGTLNYLVFENIAGNFNLTDPAHQSIIELLIHHENRLIDLAALPSDFKVYMARPRHT